MPDVSIDTTDPTYVSIPDPNPDRLDTPPGPFKEDKKNAARLRFPRYCPVNGINWECRWHGNFNIVYFGILEQSMNGLSPGQYIYKRSYMTLKLRTPYEIDLDTPKRSVRVWNEINPHFQAALYQDGWIAPFIEGTKPSKEEICDALIRIYKDTGRVIADALIHGNFVKEKNTDEIVCIDIGVALLLKNESQDSLDWWPPMRTTYKKNFFEKNVGNPKYSSIIQTTKALLYLSYYYPDIRNIEKQLKDLSIIKKLSDEYDKDICNAETDQFIKENFPQANERIITCPEVLQKFALSKLELLTISSDLFTDAHHTFIAHLMDKNSKFDDAVQYAQQLNKKGIEQRMQFHEKKIDRTVFYALQNSTQRTTFLFFFDTFAKQFSSQENCIKEMRRIMTDLGDDPEWFHYISNILIRFDDIKKGAFFFFYSAHDDHESETVDESKTVVATHVAVALENQEQFLALKSMPKQVQKNIYAIVGANNTNITSGKSVARKLLLQELITFYNTHVAHLAKYTLASREPGAHTSQLFQPQITLLESVLLASGTKKGDQQSYVNDLFQAIEFLDKKNDLHAIKSLVAIIAMMFAPRIKHGVPLYYSFRDTLIPEIMGCEDLFNLCDFVKKNISSSTALYQAFQKFEDVKIIAAQNKEGMHAASVSGV